MTGGGGVDDISDNRRMGHTGDDTGQDPTPVAAETGRMPVVRRAVPTAADLKPKPVTPEAPSATTPQRRLRWIRGRGRGGSADTARSPRRRPRLWLPATGVVVLIVVAIAAGRFLVPAGGPEAGSAPPPTVDTGAPAETPSASPTLPPLPTGPPRPSDALSAWADTIAATTGVPDVAVQAYGYAQLLIARSDPTCHLSWTTIAAIGKAETGHGQPAGTNLDHTGRSTPLLVGPPLDGTHGRALVRDTDAGAFDGDATYDRMLGALHLSPTLWRTYAADGDDDGIRDPNDIDDAAVAVATLLCAGADDLNRLSGWQTALARYRPGASYARTVFSVADQYGKQTRNIT